MFAFSDSDRPLTEEVKEAEQQLLRRRLEVRVERHSLDIAVRRRLTAPDALLWSAATGFALGEVTKKRGTVHRDEDASQRRGADEGEEELPSTLQLLLRYLAIARPILSTASTLLGPLLHRAAVRGAEEEMAQRAAEEALATAQAQSGGAPIVPGTTQIH